MRITDIKISIPSEKSRKDHPQLLAFASVIFDHSLIVHDLKIIQGSENVFIAFPSKEVTSYCPFCEKKTPVRYKDCTHCWKEIHVNEELPDYADIVHPVSNQFRLYLQNAVLTAYDKTINPVIEKADESFISGIFS